MKKLKVAIVMPTHFDVHSSLNNFLKTYEFLAKAYDVDVVLLTDEKNKVKYPGINIKKIKGFDYKTIFEKLFFIFGIPRFYYKDLDKELKDFDVITSNNPEFYAFAYQAYKAAIRYNKRFILRTSQTVDGFFLFRFTKFLVCPFVKRAYDYSKFVVFTNPQAEERCLRLKLIDDKKRSIITGHATDTECFKPIKTKKAEKTILLSVGGLYEIKGHHLIIQSLRKIVDRGTRDIELWIVGDGYYKENLQKLSKELNIHEKVIFLGKKNHDELANIYNQSDIFVLANFQEITPAVNEALACEKPVVVMECGGREFVIPDESYGLISKKFDIDGMAKKIEMLIKDKNLAGRIAKKGRKEVLDNFSIYKVAEKLYRSFTE